MVCLVDVVVVFVFNDKSIVHKYLATAIATTAITNRRKSIMCMVDSFTETHPKRATIASSRANYSYW